MKFAKQLKDCVLCILKLLYKLIMYKTFDYTVQWLCLMYYTWTVFALWAMPMYRRAIVRGNIYLNRESAIFKRY